MEEGVVLDAATISEAREEYEDLRTRVGKELHKLLTGGYKKVKKPSSPKKGKKKGKAKAKSRSPSPTRASSPSRKSPSPPPQTTASPPTSPSWKKKEKKKKKSKEPPEPRRPFGPATIYTQNDDGDLKYMEVLLSSWGDKTAINWQDPVTGATPLILAAASGNYPLFSSFILHQFLLKIHIEAVITMLLEFSASVDYSNVKGNTALHEASKHGHLTIVMSLLKAGHKVDTCNRWGNTPLSSAVRNNHRDVCEILVLVGANPEVKNSNNESPIDRADDPEFKIFLTAKRNRFLQLAQKRIAAKQQELLQQLQQQEQDEDKQETSSNSDEKEKGDNADSEKEKEKEIIVVDVVPVRMIVTEFQLILSRRAKLAQKRGGRGGASPERSPSPSLKKVNSHI